MSYIQDYYLVWLIIGNESGTWFVDLKNGSGAVGSGEPTSGSGSPRR